MTKRPPKNKKPRVRKTRRCRYCLEPTVVRDRLPGPIDHKATMHFMDVQDKIDMDGEEPWFATDAAVTTLYPDYVFESADHSEFCQHYTNINSALWLTVGDTYLS
jgi:hypothetical protein